MKKKLLAVLLGTALLTGLVAGCGQKPAETPDPAATPAESEEPEVKADLTKIKIGASPSPHAEILTFAKDLLQKEGIDLEIMEFTDYVQPNLSLNQGDLDANYFQHLPYLLDFNENNQTKLTSLGGVHYEPMGIYAGKTTDLAALPDGAQIAVPNDATNEARALLLLEAQGIIKIKPEAGLAATKLDVIENPKNVELVELEAAQLARSLSSVDLSVINGNYALQAGLDVATDSLAKEEADSVAAETYANIIAVREGDETRPELVKLLEVLRSQPVKDYIAEQYAGAVESVSK